MAAAITAAKIGKTIHHRSFLFLAIRFSSLSPLFLGKLDLSLHIYEKALSFVQL